MSLITRVQHVQYDDTLLVAFQGKGTGSFKQSGQPKTDRANFGAVFSGRIRVTKSDNANGYFIIGIDQPRGTTNRRVFFRGDALVRLGDSIVTLDNYWKVMVLVNGE